MSLEMRRQELWGCKTEDFTFSFSAPHCHMLKEQEVLDRPPLSIYGYLQRPHHSSHLIIASPVSSTRLSAHYETGPVCLIHLCIPSRVICIQVQILQKHVK